MRYAARQYATVLADIAAHATGAELSKLARTFYQVLARHGTTRLLPDIFRIAGDIERKKRGGKRVRISAAESATAENALKHFHKEDDITTVIDSNLIGGVAITVDGIRSDNTLRRRVEDLRSAIS